MSMFDYASYYKNSLITIHTRLKEDYKYYARMENLAREDNRDDIAQEYQIRKLDMIHYLDHIELIPGLDVVSIHDEDLGL